VRQHLDRPAPDHFDGCSQGGHEALTEAQRYPEDFNGILAGAPASIMTELNSVLHEYTFEANYTKPGYAGSTIPDQPEADIVLNAAIKACDPKVGIILDNQACERTFNLNSVLCSAYFDKLEKPAPFWDATDPDLQAFDQAGGKLILWQGEADWSIPFIASDAYYQAVVTANGGLAATKQFARYYALPGVGHCGGNGPDTYNGLGAVVA
jgi:pimeloyl-ACP methyl ester carboxylesterase